MSTIILPTDFSKNAMRAIDFAFDFFNKEDNHFILCHFYDIPRGGTSRLFTILDQLKEQAERSMLKVKDTVEKKYDKHHITLSTIVKQGNVSSKVERLSKEVNADFIIMGTKGTSGLQEILIGSNTSKLLKRINIPVFAIPEDYHRNLIEELFFSYDGQSIGKNAIEFISSFSNNNSLPIRLLHVRKEDESPLQNWNEVKNVFNNHRISLHEVYSSSYEEGIKRTIHNEKCMLVLIKRKQSIWESLINRSDSRKIVRHLAVPILVIPE